MLYAADIFPRHSFRSGIGKLHVCKHSSNRMVIVQSTIGLIQHFLREQKKKGQIAVRRSAFFT